jgi:hypothetical protein
VDHHGLVIYQCYGFNVEFGCSLRVFVVANDRLRSSFDPRVPREKHSRKNLNPLLGPSREGRFPGLLVSSY